MMCNLKMTQFLKSDKLQFAGMPFYVMLHTAYVPCLCVQTYPVIAGLTRNPYPAAAVLMRR
jgi:hypothetical protein